jgi:hypothetical protein
MEDVLGNQGEESHGSASTLREKRLLGSLADEYVSNAPPDELVPEFLEDMPRDRLDVEFAMAFDHVGELITKMHQARDDPAVEGG